jgi:F0F1-type ATP synthase membrane subunit b/b'
VNPTKRFFLIFFGVYLVVTVLWAAFMGPPGLTNEYLDEYKADHERYLQVIKSDAYKIHKERPNLHPAEGKLLRGVEFVKEYEAREGFHAEQKRISLFELVFSIVNAAMVVILAVRFGRKPLLGFLDEKIDDIRQKLDRSESARAKAAELRAAAEDNVARLDAQRQKVEQQAGEMIKDEKARLAEGTRLALEQLDEETEARKRAEERRAAMLVKEELVTQSVDQLAKELQTTLTPQDQDGLFDEFLGRLERHT